MLLAFPSASSGRHAQSRTVVEWPSKVSNSSHVTEMSQLFVIFSLRFPCALILREENPTFLKFSSLGNITIFLSSDGKSPDLRPCPHFQQQLPILLTRSSASPGISAPHLTPVLSSFPALYLQPLPLPIPVTDP